jgi:hypothetical protein
MGHILRFSAAYLGVTAHTFMGDFNHCIEAGFHYRIKSGRK